MKDIKQFTFGQFGFMDTICIPSGFNHEFEGFTKLMHNKARSQEDGRIVHFNDSDTVWDICALLKDF